MDFRFLRVLASALLSIHVMVEATTRPVNRRKYH
jgi:hypothetical protein